MARLPILRPWSSGGDLPASSNRACHRKARGHRPAHEIKHDGYRLILIRDGDRVRLIRRGGHDWTSRFPWIVESALKNRFSQFVIDGEAVVLGVDGVSDFNGLRSRKIVIIGCESAPASGLAVAAAQADLP